MSDAGNSRSDARKKSLRARAATGLLRLFGWRVDDRLPPVDRYVVIGAPHTSNWDFPVGLLLMAALELPARWVGKHTLFRGPLGKAMRALGGIPVDRRRSHNYVEQLVERFAKAEEEGEGFVLVIAPEGTRSHTPRWRTGFYWIARGAGVPVGLGYVDFHRKIGGVGGWFRPSGDVAADFEHIRAFYAGKRGKRPEEQGEIHAGEHA